MEPRQNYGEQWMASPEIDNARGDPNEHANNRSKIVGLRLSVGKGLHGRLHNYKPFGKVNAGQLRGSGATNSNRAPPTG